MACDVSPVAMFLSYTVLLSSYKYIFTIANSMIVNLDFKKTWILRLGWKKGKHLLPIQSKYVLGKGTKKKGKKTNKC